jgi:hypothetical protein
VRFEVVNEVGGKRRGCPEEGVVVGEGGEEHAEEEGGGCEGEVS